ncbi:MAG: methyltransferase [Deltaproteobacteria bacterium]|nr:methyltransferase [Deltaproteobacteria bacterium]
MKRQHAPSEYGHRVWDSSWLLMDYLQTLRAPAGLKVMEVGCGWGLAGIFCAQRFGAEVTCVDADPEVFPFLHLHAELNQVAIHTVSKRYEELTPGDLAGVNLLMGADICFWDEMPERLLPLFQEALAAGVSEILLADPGREPFLRLAGACEAKFDAQVLRCAVERPLPASGRILRIRQPH